MNKKRLRNLALVAAILCINSMPYNIYADDSNNKTQVSESKSVEIKSNWLNKIIAKQLNKDVKNLTVDDLLSIKKLDLKHEKIENSIPESIELLENLEYLDLNYCKIDGDIPKELSKLSKLKHLDLGNNNIKSIPKEVEEKIMNGDYTYCDVENNKFNLTKGWHYLKGNWYYLNRYGEKLTGEQRIDGKQYDFNDDGTLKSSSQNVWEKQGDKWFYRDERGQVIKNAWRDVKNKWYYFNEDGVMVTGLQKIGDKTYYFNNDGDMATGWKSINSNWYYFSSSGEMLTGWIGLNGKSYYIDKTSGIMLSSCERIIDGKKYKFNSSGEVYTDNYENNSGVSSGSWVDNYTYIQPNGIKVNTYSNYSHSSVNYNLFKYMSYPANQQSVDEEAVRLHGGITSNNCVYFLSEALRRVGVTIPLYMNNTIQFENELKARGFVYSYDLSQLKPGDIVFTNNYSHVYIFMCWDKDGYAYIVDNQGNTFGSILHRRNIYNDTSITDRATHFYFLPN